MYLLIALGIMALLGFLYFRFFKIPKVKNVIFVDGSLGTGKSAFTLHLAIKLYKRARRRWKVCNFFAKLLGKEPIEEPLLFSNIPLRHIKHVPMTLDLLMRQKRFPYKSVVFIDDISIVLDQFDYQDRQLSNSFRDFMTLFRHETRGGYFLSNAQSTAQLHYGFKNVLSDYIYIHHKTRLPFFSCLKVQELAYSSDKDGLAVTNVNNADVEDNLRLILMPNSVFRKYDSFCYSILTDGLPVEDNYIVLEKKDSLKTEKILTFKKGRYERK